LVRKDSGGEGMPKEEKYRKGPTQRETESANLIRLSVARGQN